jgi:hypothetical protein
MEKEKLERLLIDYLDGELTKPERELLEDQLASDAEARRMLDQLRSLFATMDNVPEPAPSPDLSMRLQDMLTAETERVNKTIKLQPWIYRIAAAVALIVTGVAIGYWVSVSQASHETFVAEQPVQTKQQVLEQMNDELSPSQRIQGILAGGEQKESDPDIVEALVRVMNNDPNSNVRLAALEALSTFRDEQNVRNALVHSLGTQTDPVVQLALIQLMVEMKEKEAIEYLKKIAEDESVLPAVQDEAYAGIIRLS